jgi:hypothetical protein
MHIGRNVIDYVIANNYVSANFNPPSRVTIIQPVEFVVSSSAKIIPIDVVDVETPWRHSPNKLAQAVLGLIKHC